MPLLWYGITYTGDAYYISGWGSTIRILTEFTAGAITYLIVARLTGRGTRPRVERLATTLSVVLPVLLVVGAVVLCNIAGAAVARRRPERAAEATTSCSSRC